MKNEKVELRAAAARLLYESNRDSADYGMLIDYIDNSIRIVNGQWHRHILPRTSTSAPNAVMKAARGFSIVRPALLL